MSEPLGAHALAPKAYWCVPSHGGFEALSPAPVGAVLTMSLFIFGYRSLAIFENFKCELVICVCNSNTFAIVTVCIIVMNGGGGKSRVIGP